ncbi:MULTISPECIES: EAL domain-containing protein [unclassified Serratia (in: enterobacteria)]|uniref:EAL domain-containing protein n=1 Tax=unclassified Serratia (in: enterobacteria) TaxID=2647522 RepID=UPI00307635CA
MADKYVFQQVKNHKIVPNGKEWSNKKPMTAVGSLIIKDRLAQETPSTLINQDLITDQPNRHTIQKSISEAILKYHDSDIGLLYINLDNFKKVNCAYGHLFGDRLLAEVSHTLRNCLNNGEMLARPGGDEFLILVYQATPPLLQKIAQRIINRLASPFKINQIEIYISCSIGISLCSEQSGDLDSLMRHADTAMYSAKKHGKHRFSIFSPTMNQSVAEDMWLDTNLRKGLAQNQLVIYYQPKVCSQTGNVYSVESLVRWNSPERGLISPLQFIPYAEESGLIIPLGRWVLQTVARQVAHWQRRGIDLRVAVNLSGQQLVDNCVISDLLEVLEENQLTHCPLDFELTESYMLENEEHACEVITQLRALGARIHLDDFGTGYSSLSQLIRLPLDAIKLDKSFVHGVVQQPKTQALVQVIVTIAKTLQFRVIAEGIETESESQFLDCAGVDEKQGFLFAPPMPAEQLEHWLLCYIPVPKRNSDTFTT